MATATLKVRLVWANVEAVEAFGRVVEALGDLREDLPWRSDLDEVIKDATLAAEGIHLLAGDRGSHG